jgi:hypothetical protein
VIRAARSARPSLKERRARATQTVLGEPVRALRLRRRRGVRSWARSRFGRRFSAGRVLSEKVVSGFGVVAAERCACVQIVRGPCRRLRRPACRSDGEELGPHRAEAFGTVHLETPSAGAALRKRARRGPLTKAASRKRRPAMPVCAPRKLKGRKSGAGTLRRRPFACGLRSPRACARSVRALNWRATLFPLTARRPFGKTFQCEGGLSLAFRRGLGPPLKKTSILSVRKTRCNVG